MTKKLVLSSFPMRNEEDKALHGIFVPAARKFGLTVNEFWNATTKEYMQACWDKEDSLDYVPTNYLPQMSNEQYNRMARWFANCDTAQMNAEALVVMRLPAQLPFTGQLKYLQDHVRTEEFWQYAILDCKKCRKIDRQRNGFDFDAFIWAQDLGFSYFSPEKLKIHIRQCQIACKHCGTNCQTVEGLPQLLIYAHYQWLPNWSIPESPVQCSIRQTRMNIRLYLCEPAKSCDFAGLVYLTTNP